MTNSNLKDPKKMDLLEILDHERALTDHGREGLTSETESMIQSELEAAINERSSKVDMIYAMLVAYEDRLKRVKEEKELLKDAEKSYKNKIDRIERMLRFIGRMLPAGKKGITGNKYKFLLSKRSTSAVVINSCIENWTEDERNKFCIQKEIEIITKTVVRSLTGKVLEESTTPKTKTEIIPNEDAIRNASKNNERLPEGVTVYQTIAVLRRRTHGELDQEASRDSRKLLPEADCT